MLMFDDVAEVVAHACELDFETHGHVSEMDEFALDAELDARMDMLMEGAAWT